MRAGPNHLQQSGGMEAAPSGSPNSRPRDQQATTQASPREQARPAGTPPPSRLQHQSHRPSTHQGPHSGGPSLGHCPPGEDPRAPPGHRASESPAPNPRPSLRGGRASTSGHPPPLLLPHGRIRSHPTQTQ